MVDSDPAFNQQLLDVSVGKSVAEIPADRHHDHIRWGSDPCECRPRWTYWPRATTHQHSLPELVTRLPNSAPCVRHYREHARVKPEPGQMPEMIRRSNRDS